ncbi:TPA: hypothetical protein EYP66_03220 [Candidatus Poribacteria bacterium]|nr:hypothetical protein [Candidatus Poribacteria bacterium]
MKEKIQTDFEHLTVNKLIETHRKLHKDKLVAAVIYGPLAKGESTGDIDILEIVEGWQKAEVNPEAINFGIARELLQRGELRLLFLAPEELERLAEQFHPAIVGIAEYYEVCFDKRGNYVEKLFSALKEEVNKARANSLAKAGYGG